MSTPAILAIATGVPEGRHDQNEIYEHLLPKFDHAPHARAIFQHSGVAYRHMVVDEHFYDREQRTESRNDFYLANALPLGEATVRRCLEAADCPPGAVDDFFVVSCTGIDVPGLDLQLAGRLGMRPDLRRTCVLGMGCYAAFPALLRAREAVAGNPGRRALVLALELCSVHMQMDDTFENMVVFSLFADGAGAALIGSDAGLRDGPTRGPRLLDAATYCDYTGLEQMAFHITDHGFRMRLTASVPGLLAAKVEEFVDGLLHRNGLERSDVRFWGVHPGGRKILDDIQSQLGLADHQLDFSRAVLRDYGNMSSPTILFVLDEIQRQGEPGPGDYGLLLGFGPGLTTEGALVQW